MDKYSRCCLSLLANTSITGERVVRALNRLVELWGCSACIASYKKAEEFTKMAVLQWAGDHRTDWHDITPGRSLQSGFTKDLEW